MSKSMKKLIFEVKVTTNFVEEDEINSEQISAEIEKGLASLGDDIVIHPTRYSSVNGQVAVMSALREPVKVRLSPFGSFHFNMYVITNDEVEYEGLPNIIFDILKDVGNQTIEYINRQKIPCGDGKTLCIIENLDNQDMYGYFKSIVDYNK